MDKNYDVITFISKCLYFKKIWVASFADIIIIVTMFIETIFKDSRKFKRTRNYASECNLYRYFLIEQNFFKT